MIFEVNELYQIKDIRTDEITYDNGTADIDDIKNAVYQLDAVAVEREVIGFSKDNPPTQIYLTFEAQGHNFVIPFSEVTVERIENHENDPIKVIKEGKIYEL